jgi:hypothetical protein
MVKQQRDNAPTKECFHSPLESESLTMTSQGFKEGLLVFGIQIVNIDIVVVVADDGKVVIRVVQLLFLVE